MTAALLLALAVLPQAPDSAPPPPEYSALELPGADTLDRAAWRAHLRPAAGERERIDWIPSFAEGLGRAGEEGRPLLFWAMNGHPLGCT